MKLLYKISLIIFLLSLILLITGSPFLMILINKNPEIPLGSLTTALGIIALPTLLFAKVSLTHSMPQTWKKRILIASKIGILLTFFWWPLGRYLSGNWSNSFINIPEQSKLFWNLTYGLIIYILLLWLAFLATKFFYKKTS